MEQRRVAGKKSQHLQAHENVPRKSCKSNLGDILSPSHLAQKFSSLNFMGHVAGTKRRKDAMKLRVRFMQHVPATESKAEPIRDNDQSSLICARSQIRGSEWG